MLKCKNCQAYDRNTGYCRVAIMLEGEKQYLPVLEEDDCHWEKIQLEIDQMLIEEIANCEDPKKKLALKQELNSNLDIKQTRVWSDGAKGFIQWG